MRIALLNTNDRAGLALCRSLGSAGHQVTSIRLAPERGPADHSRYCRSSLGIRSPDLDLKAAGGDLAEAVRGHDYLIPITDRACELAYFARDRLDVPIVGPERERYERAKNKLEAGRALQQWLKLPEMVVVSQASEARGVTFPCFAKPVYSTHVVDGVLRATGVSIVRSLDDVERKLRDTHPIPLMLQKPVSGPGIGINLAAFEGELLGVSVTERLHEPGYGGGSSYRRSGEVTSEILEIAREAAARFEWTGFLMIECKRAPDGLYFMELNCRPWGSIGLSIFAGADYPRLLIDAFEGRRTSVQVAKPGVYTRHLKKDIGWALRHPRAIPEWAWSFRRLFAGVEQFDIERLSDPLPALAQLRTGLVRKIADRYLGRPDPVSSRDWGHVLFVCKGNINRSVVAEHVAKKLGVEAGSAALLPRQGRRASAPAEAFLEARGGAGAAAHRSTAIEQLLRPDSAIVAFERRHIREIRRRAPGRPVYLLRQLAGGNGDIADPDGKDRLTYESCFREIEQLVRKAFGTSGSPV